MKTTNVTILLSIIVLCSSLAGSIECQLFKLTGEMPPGPEVIRLASKKLLQPIYSSASKLSSDGKFDTENKQIIDFPTSFDEFGNPNEIENQKIGFSFSGEAPLIEGLYKIKFSVEARTHKSDHIYLHRNGAAMPQPILNQFNLESGVELRAGESYVFFSPKTETGEFYALAIKASE